MDTKYFLLFLALIVLIPGTSLGETLYLQNGDVITGKIQSFDEESATLETPYEGTVTINRSEIRYLTSERPLTIRFRDGTYFTGRFQSGEEGRILLRQQEDAERTINLDEVREIFPEDPRTMLRRRLEVDLSGNINAGFNRVSGNTNRESYHLDGNMRARTPTNRYTLGFRYNQEQTNGNLTEENALTFGKYDHFLGERWFLFASTTLEQDTFQDLDLRSNFSSGVGYQFYETKERFLLLETGISYINETYTNGVSSEDSFGTRYAIDYEEGLIQDVRFFHFQEGLSGSDEEGTFRFRSRTGFRFPIAQGLQSTLQMNLDWDEDPPAGNRNTDREYIFTLGYSF